MLEVTNLDQLREMAKGEVVTLPSFVERMPFNARVKRPSLLNLIQQGKIPNQLLSAANEMFYGKNDHKKADENIDMKEMSDLMLIMAKSALIEPSIEQLEELDLELTDEQLVALFNYTQKGLKAIEKFRPKQPDNVDTGNEQEVQDKAKSSTKSN